MPYLAFGTGVVSKASNFTPKVTSPRDQPHRHFTKSDKWFKKSNKPLPQAQNIEAKKKQ